MWVYSYNEETKVQCSQWKTPDTSWNHESSTARWTRCYVFSIMRESSPWVCSNEGVLHWILCCFSNIHCTASVVCVLLVSCCWCWEFMSCIYWHYKKKLGTIYTHINTKQSNGGMNTKHDTIFKTLNVGNTQRTNYTPHLITVTPIQYTQQNPTKNQQKPAVPTNQHIDTSLH